MPWFRVDDTLTWHGKHVRAGNAAVGLWTRAASYCMQQLTDGFIDADMARTLGTRGEIKKLCDVKLWHPATRDGVDGYEFHDWLEYQPSREQLEADRAAAKARQRRARDAAKAKRNGTVTP